MEDSPDRYLLTDKEKQYIPTLTIKAYDWNCPQHITPRYTEEEICEDLSRFCPEKIESRIESSELQIGDHFKVPVIG
jgi:hypothetical protein